MINSYDPDTLASMADFHAKYSIDQPLTNVPASWADALRSLDAETIAAWMRAEFDYSPPAFDLDFWITIHRARINCSELAEEERARSAQFLLDSYIGDDL